MAHSVPIGCENSRAKIDMAASERNSVSPRIFGSARADLLTNRCSVNRHSCLVARESDPLSVGFESVNHSIRKMNHNCYSRVREPHLILTRIGCLSVWFGSAHFEMPHLRPAEVTFLELRNTVFCVSCELISYNNSSKCLACSSTALLSLSRVLGGSLRQQPQTRLIKDEMINRVVENILENSEVEYKPAAVLTSELIGAQNFRSSTAIACRTLPHSLPQLQPAMRWIVERACTLTRADGAALALSRQGKLLCHAHAGSSAPDLGVEIDLNQGISGLCARTGVSWRCDSSESDPYVDRNRCRELGSQSVLAAPVSHLNSVLGVLEVFSSHKNAFTDHDVASVQLLTGLLVVAITRAGSQPIVRESASVTRIKSELIRPAC
jgi:putative methionine-R-sulfoxide reductase with GAF domain